MLVNRSSLPLALVVVAALLPRPAQAAGGVDWVGSLQTAAITPEEADRAFARPATDGAADPVVRVDESALRYYA